MSIRYHFAEGDEIDVMGERSRIEWIETGPDLKEYALLLPLPRPGQAAGLPFAMPIATLSRIVDAFDDRSCESITDNPMTEAA